MSIISKLKRIIRGGDYSSNEVLVPPEVKIGEHCEVYKGVYFGSEPYLIEIGDYVRISSGVKFATHDGGLWVLRNLHMLDDADYFGRIKVGNNVHIGQDCFILPGVTIGNNCIIGVRSVVTKSVPDNTVYAGQPARFIETIDEYYEKHKNNCDLTKHMTPDEKKDYLVKKYNI